MLELSDIVSIQETIHTDSNGTHECVVVLLGVGAFDAHGQEV